MLLLSIVACNSNARKARDFSNAIVEKETSLTTVITACEERVGKYYQAQQYDKIADEGRHMEELLQNKIDEIRAMPAPDAKGAERFKSSYIDYFKFIQSLYTKYKDFGMAETDEKRQEIFQEIQNSTGRKTEVVNDLRKAQQDFAEANGAKVEKPN
jgi:hypothetical protein